MVEQEVKDVMDQVVEAQAPTEATPGQSTPDFYIIKEDGMRELQALIGHIENAGKTGLLNESKALDRLVGTLNSIILKPQINKQ
jgi:hypothetical protein